MCAGHFGTLRRSGCPALRFACAGASVCACSSADRFEHKVDDSVYEALSRAPLACKVVNFVYEGARAVLRMPRQPFLPLLEQKEKKEKIGKKGKLATCE